MFFDKGGRLTALLTGRFTVGEKTLFLTDAKGRHFEFQPRRGLKE